MKVALSNFTLLDWKSPFLAFQFAEQSLMESNKVVKTWFDFELGKNVFEVENRPADVPMAGVIWEVVE